MSLEAGKDEDRENGELILIDGMVCKGRCQSCRMTGSDGFQSNRIHHVGGDRKWCEVRGNGELKLTNGVIGEGK